MKHLNSLAITLLPALTALPAAMHVHAADSPWQYDIGGSAGYNNNLGQAERDRDIVEDFFATITAGANYGMSLGTGQELTLRGFLETEQWEEVRDISRLSAGGKLIFDWQPTAGPTAPAYQFNTTLRLDDYAHSQRDSTVSTTQLLVTKPINPQLSATLGIEYRNRDSSGTVWDLSHVRGFLGGAFAFSPGWSAHGTYSYLDGDVWSVAQTTSCNGTPAGDIFGLVSAADAIEPDEAFNEAFCGSWHAYRLPATAHTLELGVSKDIGESMAVDFSVLGLKVDARGDNEYDTQVFRVSLSKRF
jgi:hypothetical protein